MSGRIVSSFPPFLSQRKGRSRVVGRNRSGEGMNGRGVRREDGGTQKRKGEEESRYLTQVRVGGGSVRGKRIGREPRIGFKTGHLRRGPPRFNSGLAASVLSQVEAALSHRGLGGHGGPPIHTQSTTSTKQGNVPWPSQSSPLRVLASGEWEEVWVVSCRDRGCKPRPATEVPAAKTGTQDTLNLRPEQLALTGSLAHWC